MTANKTEKHLCPFCHEAIKKSAIKCKHCQTMLIPIESQNKGSGGATVVNNITTQTEEKKKPTTRIVDPSTYVAIKDKSGLGLVNVTISVIFLMFAGAMASEEYANEQEMLDVLSGAFFCLFLVVAHAYWLYKQPEADKSYPKASFVICAITAVLLISGIGNIAG